MGKPGQINGPIPTGGLYTEPDLVKRCEGPANWLKRYLQGQGTWAASDVDYHYRELTGCLVQASQDHRDLATYRPTRRKRIISARLRSLGLTRRQLAVCGKVATSGPVSV